MNETSRLLLAILVAVAAVFDIRSRRIPNWLVATGIVAGAAWNVWGGGWPGALRAAEGLGTGFALYFPLYLLRARGAGDVKLLAAIGAITGPGDCFRIFLLTALLGGAIALIVVAVRGRLGRTLFNVAWIVKDLSHLRAPHRSGEELDVRSDKAMRLPHAALLAAGTAAFIAMAGFVP